MFVCLTDNAANACERHFQLLRLRRERSKQPALAETPYGRPGFNGHPLHGCSWTMLRQIKLKQPEQDFRILHGNRKLECAFEHLRSFLPEVAFDITVFMDFEAKSETQFVGCKGAGHKTGGNLFQKPVKNKYQRF